MKTRKFLDAVVGDDFVPVKTKAMGMIETMSDNQFEDLFIDLAQSFNMYEHLNTHAKSSRSLANIMQEIEVQNNPAIQFGGNEDDD